jgi:hypothetical protein
MNPTLPEPAAAGDDRRLHQRAAESAPRLIPSPAAARYLGGERPERFGVEPLRGKRQKLYDRRAIDAALDRISRLNPIDFDTRRSESSPGSRELAAAFDPDRDAADAWFAGNGRVPH